MESTRTAHVTAGHQHRPHSQRRLEAVAEELRATAQRLQEEKRELLLQSSLLTGLAELFGLYRSALQADDELLACLTTGLEGQLLDQLTARLPSMGLNSSSNTHSTQSSNNSNSNSGVGADVTAEQDTADSSSPPGGGCADVVVEAEILMAADTSMQHAARLAAMHQDSSCLESLQEPLPGETQQQVSTQVWQLQQLLQPVSPDHDPFMLARHVFLGPFDARAHTITLEDLKQMWLQDVQELRACLQQLQSTLQQGGVLLVAPPPGDSDDVPAAAATRASPHACRTDRHPQDEQRQQQQHTNPLKAIRDRMMSMYHLVNSLSIAGRHNLYFDLQLENWKTGERLQEPCRERHRAALQELQLTPAQLQRMAAGWKFFQQLLAPIVAERKQLHSQGLQTVTEDSCSGPQHSSQGAKLQAQREQAARLCLLSRKDALMRGTMCMFIQGCLSWVQQAKLRILMSPFHVNMGFFCVVVMEHVRAQQQQEEEAFSAKVKPCVPAAAPPDAAANTDSMSVEGAAA